MDRASRIRQMREGQRANRGDDDAPDAGDDGTDDSTAVADQSGAPQGTETSAGDDATAADVPDDGVAPNGNGSADADAAAAAAQRAAQAAAQIPGGVADDAAAGRTAPATQESASDPDATAGAAAAQPQQGPTGVELPDEASIQSAIADEVLESEEDAPATPATRRGADAANAATAEDSVRVLEFTLGDEHYCLDIAHVEEIVKRETITRVPNTPEYVEGVVDLRGQITTILDPKLLLDIDQEGSESLLVVFAPDEFEDQGAIGWVVDEVRQVAPIVKSEVSAAPVDADYIEGVVDRDDEAEFVIWTDPEVAIELATGEQGDD